MIRIPASGRTHQMESDLGLNERVMLEKTRQGRRIFTVTIERLLICSWATIRSRTKMPAAKMMRKTFATPKNVTGNTWVNVSKFYSLNQVPEEPDKIQHFNIFSHHIQEGKGALAPVRSIMMVLTAGAAVPSGATAAAA